MPERPQRAVSRELCGRSEMVRESRKKGTVVSRWRRTRWRQIIVAQARYLEYECELLCADHQNGTAGRQCSAAARECPAHKAVKNHLEAARRAAGASGRPAAGASDPQANTARRVDLWSGGSVNGAFADLHAARVVLVDLYAEEDIQAAKPAVLARLRTCLPPTDQRRQRAEALFGSQASGAPADAHRHGWLTREDRIQPTKPKPLIFRCHPGCSASELACRRAALRDAMQVSYDAADQQYAHVRSFRNVLITGTIVLTLLVIAVCLLGARNPKAIPLCFNPSSTSTVPGVSALQKVCPTSETADPNAPPGGDATVVALMGVLGAALSATLAVQKLRGTSAPYSVPVSLALFKLPAGALTAIAGLLLIKGGFVPGFSQLDTQGQILAYAIVFGVAQHLVTRLVDQRADDVLSKLPSKEPSLPTEKQTGQATQPAGGENTAPTVTT
jgi:hypothetical protein